MPQVGEAYVDVRARTDKLVQDVEKGAKEAGENVGKSFLQASAAIGVARGALSLLSAGFNEATEAARGIRQTEAVLRSTGEAAGVSAEHVDELTGRLQDKVAVDDDVIRSGTNLLLTFTGIRNEAGKGNDVFDRTNAVMLDMSAAMGTDVTSAAIQLGKALNEPQQGLTALTRVGVSFTEAQKEQIKTLAESGRTMEAQKIILGELEREFSGSAEAQVTGAQRAQVALGNLSESIGNAVIPVVETLAPLVTKTAEAFSALPTPVSGGIVAVGGLAAGFVAAAKVVDIFSSATETLSPVVNAARGAIAAKAVASSADAIATFAAANATEIQAIAEGQSAVAAGAAAVAQQGLAVANTEVAASATAATVAGSALNPVMLGVVAATAAVGAAVLIFTGRKNEQAEAIKRVEKALFDETGAMNTSKDALDNYISANSRFEARNQIDDLDRLGLSYKALGEELRAGTDGLRSFVDQAARSGEIEDVTERVLRMDPAMRATEVAAGRLIEVNGRWYDGNVDLVKSFELEQQGLEKAAEAGVREQARRSETAKAVLDEAEARAKATGTAVDWIRVAEQLGDTAKTAASGVDDLAGSTLDLHVGMDQSLTSIYTVEGALRDFSSAVDRAIEASFGVGDATRNYERAVRDATGTTKAGGGAQRDAAKDARDMEKALKAVEDAEGALADAIERRTEIQKGPTADQVKIAEIEARQRKRDLADATDDVADAEKRLQDAQKANTGEAIAKRISEAERDLASAKRDVDQATRAVTTAQENLNRAREGGDPEAIARAEDALADAQDRVKDRTDAAEEAQRDLEAAQRAGEGSSRDVEKAQRDLEAAHDDVTLAEMEARTAEENLKETRDIGKEGSLALKDANREVEQAQDAVRDATQRVKDLEDQQNQSRTGGGGTIETLATVEEKTLAVATAGEAYIKKLLEMNAPAETIQRALQKIHEDLDKTTESSPEAQEAARRFFDTISREADAAKGKIDGSTAAADKLQRVLDEAYRTSIEIALGIPLGIPPGSSSPTPGRAGGGPVAAGGLYLVGERGPELVQFGGDAAVFPHDQLSAALNSNRGRGDVVNVTIGSVIGTEAGARRVASLTGAAVARVQANRRMNVDTRGTQVR